MVLVNTMVSIQYFGIMYQSVMEFLDDCTMVLQQSVF